MDAKIGKKKFIDEDFVIDLAICWLQDRNFFFSKVCVLYHPEYLSNDKIFVDVVLGTGIEPVRTFLPTGF